MSYSIIFETTIIKLSDGRLLHLSLQGCNNDNAGRRRDDWHSKIYTENDFVKYAEKFMVDSKPIKESDGFDLKIRSKYCTYYDYGKHLLRMLKKATSFDELKRSGKFVTFSSIDGATVYEVGKVLEMSMKEFDDYFYKKLYNGGIRYRINCTPLYTESDVVNALDNGLSIRTYISK